MKIFVIEHSELSLCVCRLLVVFFLASKNAHLERRRHTCQARKQFKCQSPLTCSQGKKAQDDSRYSQNNHSNIHVENFSAFDHLMRSSDPQSRGSQGDVFSKQTKLFLAAALVISCQFNLRKCRQIIKTYLQDLWWISIIRASERNINRQHLTHQYVLPWTHNRSGVLSARSTQAWIRREAKCTPHSFASSLCSLQRKVRLEIGGCRKSGAGDDHRN